MGSLSVTSISAVWSSFSTSDGGTTSTLPLLEDDGRDKVDATVALGSTTGTVVATRTETGAATGWTELRRVFCELRFSMTREMRDPVVVDVVGRDRTAAVVLAGRGFVVGPAPAPGGTGTR